MRVTTLSGTVYDFNSDGSLVRRIGGAPMRRDHEGLRVVHVEPIVVGKPMRITLDGVAMVGLTERVTTPVVKVIGVGGSLR